MFRNGASLTTAMGDSFYQAQMFSTAYIHFTKAISASKALNQNNKKTLHILYAKRSLSLLKMNELKKCLEDIQCSLKETTEESDIDLGLKNLRSKLIQTNLLRSDAKLYSIPEEDEFCVQPFDCSQLEVSININETFIMNASIENPSDEHSFDDGNESASLEDLLEECEFEKVTKEEVQFKLSLIQDGDDESCSSDDESEGGESDSTLTDSTLKCSLNKDNDDSNFVSDGDSEDDVLL